MEDSVPDLRSTCGVAGVMLAVWCAEGLRGVQAFLTGAQFPTRLEVFPYQTPPETVGPGDLVFCLGAETVVYAGKAGLVPKNRTVGSLRGVLWDMPSGAKMIVSYPPSIQEVNHGLYQDLLMDCQLVRRFLERGSIAPFVGDYRYVDDLSDCMAAIDSAESKLDVALDLETQGKDAFDPTKWIVSLQVSYQEGTADVVYFPPNTTPTPQVLQQVTRLLNDPKVYLKGANLKYDLIWLAVKWGLECTNFRFDTGIVGSILDENRSNSLKTHARIYTSMGGYADELDKQYSKGDMASVPKKVLLTYAGGDADATLRVASQQKRELLRDARLTRFYAKILHPAARAYELVERCGVCVDVDKYRALEADLEREVLTLEQKALGMMSKRIRAKWAGKEGLTKASMLTDYLFTPQGLNLKPLKVTEKTGAASTALDHLLMFSDHPEAGPFIRALKEYNSAKKTLSTFVVGFLAHLKTDNRFHPSYFLYATGDSGGTVTGRLSAKGPAFQTLPSHTAWSDRLRECFIAPPGHVICGPDYAQGELKIAACVANEQDMIEAYQKGIDLHALSASAAMGLSWEEALAMKLADPKKFDSMRQTGKAINFGLAVAEGEMVLTDTGLIPIEEVKLHHKLWDGMEWVSHDGIIHQGVFDVITWDGITATPDHKVWLVSGEKVELSEARRRNSKLARTSTDSGEPLFWNLDPRTWSPCPRVLQEGEDVLLPMPGSERGQRPRFIHRKNQKLCLSEGGQVRTRPTSEGTWSSLRLYGSEVQQKYAQAIRGLHGAWDKGVVFLSGALRSMGVRDLPLLGLQRVGVRPDRQRWTLRTSEFAFGDSKRESPEQKEHCSYSVSGKVNSIDGFSKPIYSTQDVPLRSSRSDWGADYGESSSVCEGKAQGVEGNLRKVKVYDILNAGPRRRFTCNGVLVSNCYGMSALGFVEYSKATYGITVTLDEAEAYRSAFFNRFPGLPYWHEYYKREARANKRVYSPLGRVRHLPLIDSPIRSVAAKAERQAVNSPIQSTLSDMALWATALLHQRYKMNPDSGFCAFGMVHDQLLFYAPEDDRDLWCGRILDVMEGLPFHEVGWNPQLKFTADMKVGGNLKDLEKWVRTE